MISGIWKIYLLVVADMLIVMGVAFAALAIVPSWFGALNWLNDIFGGARLTGEDAMRVARFGYGLMGAVTAGWGIVLFLLVKHGVHEGRTWRVVVASVLGWCVLDVSVSLATGFALNAVVGTALLVTCFGVPWTGQMRAANRPALEALTLFLRRLGQLGPSRRRRLFRRGLSFQEWLRRGAPRARSRRQPR